MGQPAESRVDPESNVVSFEVLTELILRRIMRVACGVGALGIVTAFLGPGPINRPAMVAGIIATVAVFAATFLSVRVRVLSIVYPFALATVSLVALAGLGPRADGWLLMAGGIFIGSLVLGRVTLLAMVGVALAAVVSIYARNASVMTDPMKEIWASSARAMVAVITPAAVAGRMIVAALARALRERQALVAKGVAERQELERTVRTLETTRQQLTHAQKVELMSQMAGGIAHDMNNTLTAVLGEASLLPDAVAEERERLLEATGYAAQLTRQLMLFTRKDASRPRALDLAAELQGFVKAIRRLIPSDIAFKTEIVEGPCAVMADPTQLFQIVMNLCGNAKDAMPDGGTLTVGLRRDDKLGRAVLEVRDTGSGIAPDTLPGIFDPFFTTKPAGKGTGLGLANVKQLVEGIHGSVAVESVLGEGTLFRLTIPLTDAPVGAAPKPRTEPRPRSATVLVVDDDVRVRAFVFSALERLGYRVLEAPTIAAAVEAVRAHPDRVDLLLTDVVMAGGGGVQAIHAIRAEIAGIPVLVMSGYADDEATRRGVSQGQFPFIAKPFTSSDLAFAVEDALAHHGA